MSCYHPVPSITTTMIQFHPLPPQWRRCQKGTREASSSIHYRHNGGKAHVKHPVPSITATMEEMPERHTLAGQIMVSLDILCDRPYVLLLSSSIHYRHNGGDARKAHVKHPVPSITATMEEMPERHTLSIHYRHNGGDARKAHVKHPLPPQWRRCQKGTH